MNPAPTYLAARFVCALAIFSALLGSTAPSPLYPIYVAHFGLAQVTATAIFAIYGLGALGTLLLSARFIARVRDRRRVLAFGLCVAFAGALTLAFAQSVAPLLIGRILSGIGTGAITGLASSMLYEFAPPARRARAATIATLAFTAGAAGGPLLTSAALARELAPTTTPFLVIAGFCVVALVGLATVPWPPAPARPAAAPGRGQPAAKPRAALPPHFFRVACLAVSVAWMSGSILMAIGADLGLNLFALTSVGLIGLIPAAHQLGAGIGQVVWGRVSALRAIRIGVVGIAATQIAMVLAAPGAHGFVLLATTPLCGFFYGAAFVGALGLANMSAAPERRAEFVSRFYVIGYLANMLPALALGYFIDAIGLGPAFYLFSGLLVLVAAAAFGLASLRRAVFEQARAAGRI
ncbi:MAG: MFS transporter [Rhodovulum sulfidophilum]|uniref:MFS transporter n=1 Tax=Rhodovulum sulfidophilum TaxID=35806 RepID=A0A2W5Q0R8_RHOSU|nr:MAG: MFS transporter [Rhodovulum sulfidophilum]